MADLDELIHMLKMGGFSISGGDFVDQAIDAIRREPERFFLFMRQYSKTMRETRKNLSDDEVDQIVWHHMAMMACFADYTMDEIAEKRKTIVQMYDEPKNYGTVMRIFCDQMGVEGLALREYILSFNDI